MKKGESIGAAAFLGLNFERETDLQELLVNISGYKTAEDPHSVGTSIFFHNKCVARHFRGNEFYIFLAESGVVWKDIISERLLPDDVILNISHKTLFIIDIERDGDEASIHEDLMLCDFKRKQYMKLATPLGLTVEYVYILNDWFKKPEYRDVLDYIRSVNCHYRFNELPLSWLCLPTPKVQAKA